MSSRGQPSRKKSPLLIRSIEHVLPVNAVLIIAKFAIFPSFSFLTVSVMDSTHGYTYARTIKRIQCEISYCHCEKSINNVTITMLNGSRMKINLQRPWNERPRGGGKSRKRNLVKSEARGSRVLARVLQFIASFLRVKAYYEPHT